MMLLGDKKEVILLVRKHRSRYYGLVCIGRKAHYRKDGSCKHTDFMLEHAKPEMRHLIKVDPWGGKRRQPAVGEQR